MNHHAARVRRSGCSCGCVGHHEVARRQTFDGGLVIIRTDVIRLFLPGAMSPAHALPHDGHTRDDIRWFYDWSTLATIAEVAARMTALCGAP